MKFKLDLHAHTSDFAHLFFTNPNNQNYVTSLLKDLYKKHGNLILGIANFNDDRRYERFVEISKKLPKEYKVDYTFEEIFITISRGHQKIHFIKCDEIQTNRGHILIVGYEGMIKKRTLNEVLKNAYRNKCIIIVSHPLHNVMIGHFIIKKISLTEKEIVKNKKLIDAIELDPYFPGDWKKVKEISRKEKIPVIAESDAHFLGEFFKSYFELGELKFKNPNILKKSLKKALKKSIKIHAEKHNFVAGYKHILQVFIENFGKKIGLINEK